jgi:hypothetical protein
MERRIGEDEKVTVNVSGAKVFGSAAGAGEDVFSVLDRAVDAVRTGTSADVGESSSVRKSGSVAASKNGAAYPAASTCSSPATFRGPE